MSTKRVWVSDKQWVFEDAVQYKDPDAILDYAIDLANGGSNSGLADDTGWLQGDTISSVTWSVPSGITKVTDNKNNTRATIWLSGGTLGNDYLVTARFVTASGRTTDVSLLVKVRHS